MNKLTLNLKEESFEKIKIYSKKYNILKEELCEMIIDAWSTYGGLIWSGDNQEFQAFLVDWPSKRKTIKLKN